MPINLNKQMLDLKTWDMCTPCPAASVANSFLIGSDGPTQGLMHVVSAAIVWWYSPLEDGWVQLASPALAGTFGAGVCGTQHPQGPSGTAQAGTGAGVLVTNLALLADLSPKLGKRFAGRITGGTGAGQDFVITSNTTGANSVCYITTPAGAALATAPDATSTYTLYTGRFYVLNAGTIAAGSFKAYDHATQTWLTLGNTNLPASWGTDGRIVGTPGNAKKFATGTATSGAASSLTNSAKAWAVNQWANFQVRISAGAGAGQVRKIASNTATAVTTTAAWTVNPDATSVYQIEGDDDALYLMGNNAVTMYKYSISANTWAVMAPAVARGGAAGAGANLHWVYASNTPNFDNESAIVNGRRLYSFRAGGGNFLDVFDIASNSWSALAYGRQNEVINAGASWGYDGVNRMVCQISPVAGTPARYVAYDVRANNLEPIGALLYAPGTVLLGDKANVLEYDDGAGTPLKMLYQLRHSGTEMHRVELF